MDGGRERLDRRMDGWMMEGGGWKYGWRKWLDG